MHNDIMKCTGRKHFSIVLLIVLCLSAKLGAQSPGAVQVTNAPAVNVSVSPASSSQVPAFHAKINPGVIDLSEWDPRIHGSLSLKQGWQFVWNELMDPPGLNLANLTRLQTQTRPLDAGTPWTTHVGGYIDLPRFGYGTYILKVILPENHPPLSISTGPVGSSVRLFWGDSLIGEQGRPAADRSSYQGMWNGMTMPLPEKGNEVYLMAQVANWDDLTPGFQTVPVLGLTNTLTAERERGVSLVYLIAGLFLIMGIYHLFLFLYRHADLSPLWFAIICFLLSARVLVTDDALITTVLPVSDLKAVVASSYISFSLLVLFFGLFITSLFRFPVNNVFNIVNGAISGLYSVFIAVAPVWLFTEFLRPYQIYSIAAGLTMITLLIAALATRQKSAIMFFLGFVFVLATAMYDILKTLFLWNGPSLAPVGIVVFVFFQSMVLTRNSTSAIETAERLSKHLQKINSSMARFVPKELLLYLNRENVTEIQLGDHKEQHMAVLFADIKSFSRISENLSPEATFKLINKFLAEIGPIIRKHRGFVDKYLGDGVMALFHSGPRDAIAAGIEMCKVMGHVNEDRIRLGQEPVDIGVGIHYGPLMLGTIGEPERIDGTVLSDAVNLASRLQGLTRALGGHLLVTEASLRHIPAIEDFQFRMLGSFKVYNRSETVSVVEFFDSEEGESWKLKRATRRDFERAVYYYQSNQLHQALKAFLAIRKTAPGDKACEYYIERLSGMIDGSAVTEA